MRDLAFEFTAGPVQALADIVALGPGLAAPGTRMRFSRNAEIFGEGETADYAYRVISGAVRVIRFTSEGRRQILAFHLPGDLFGMEAGRTHTLSAEAVGDAEIVLVRRTVIDKAAKQDIKAAHAVIGLLQQQLQSAQEHALVLGRKGAGERVAAFLLQLCERLAAVGEIDLPMSRADIADYLGLTIETVSRAFTQMERDRAIALPSSRHVVFRDRSALHMLQAA
jgi:CRP/FNR family transcriptional regulator, nitrogen fixation regulation protein